MARRGRGRGRGRERENLGRGKNVMMEFVGLSVVIGESGEIDIWLMLERRGRDRTIGLRSSDMWWSVMW